MVLDPVQTKIAIIGAGASGLSAAVQLARNGWTNLTIFEARREAGGRTRSYTDLHTGDVLDNGQHLLMGCYTSTLDYLETIGSQKLLERTPLRIPFWSATGVRSFLIDRSVAPPLNLLSGLARTSLLNFSEKRAASNLGKAIWRHKLPPDLSAMTCSNLFERFRQPASLVTTLWAPFVLATINARPDDASAELFVNVLGEAFFSSRAASALLLPKCGLSELLIDPAIRYLTAKQCSLRMGCPVRAIEETDHRFIVKGGRASRDGVSGEAASGDGASEEFDAVILATPQSALGVPSGSLEVPSGSLEVPTGSLRATSVDSGRYSPIVNAYLWIDKPIFNAPIHAFIGTTLQWAFPKPSVYAPSRVALTVSAADELVAKSNEEICAILWNDIQTTVPAAREAGIVHYQIIKEKRATPLFTPEAERERPGVRTAASNFYRAGDCVQNGLPATIEGAIRNGYAAASALMGKRS